MGEDGLQRSTPPGGMAAGDRSGARREIFWHNVVREILSSLAATAAMLSGRLSATASGAATGTSPEHEMFDGRMAVITRLGQRIPIADVYPVFACSVPTARGMGERMRSADVQCSIFQIRTPTGEVYTLPVHEIMAVHSLSESLVRKMESLAAAKAGLKPDEEKEPFGFAAFRRLGESEKEEGGDEED